VTDREPPSAEAEALARYRAASRRRRTAAAGPDRRRAVRTGRTATPSGPGPDARDPQRLGDIWRALADGRGWTNEVAVWSLANRWEAIVGPQVAAHVDVVSFDPRPATATATDPTEGASVDGASADRGPAAGRGRQQALLPDPEPAPAQDRPGTGGTLQLRADSGAWQQQMVWNLAHLQRRLDEELGAGVVGRIVVLGPSVRRPHYGPRRVTR
jgi:predicted nucleic acid-binding Zn ribbon protein